MEPPPLGDDPSCTFGECFCRWRRFCSSQIPHVGPGRDYERVPPGPDRRDTWSLLVGFTSPSADNGPLRLRRFRVARSGRVLGQSDAALEILDNVGYGAKGKSSVIYAAGATPSPDGRSLSLCLFCRDLGLPTGVWSPPRPVELHLDFNAERGITTSPLPHLQQEPFMPTRPISAAGDLWAPYFTKRCPSHLVMLRLDKESAQWVEVAAIDPPHGTQDSSDDCALHGYVVVRDTTILLSLEPPHLFLVFDCSTFAWNVVLTTETEKLEYISIPDRGLYVEEDDNIYFLRHGIVYAYKLCYHQNENQYRMAPPTTVECVCPFRNEGYEFLTYLGDRVMCFVWISAPLHRGELRCECDTLHVIITTFQAKGDNGSAPKGVKILHSTCRRLDILPSKSSVCRFWFLQEYEESTHNEKAMPPTKKKKAIAVTPSMHLKWMEAQARSSVAERSKMLTCCRKFLNEPPFGCAFMLEGSAIQINKALYVICQVPNLSAVYKISILDGRLKCDGKTLTPLCKMDTYISEDVDDLMAQPLQWHFVCGRTSIYAVPYRKGDIYKCVLDVGTVNILDIGRPIDDFSIALVIRVGQQIIAISDTLGRVCYLSSRGWERLGTSESAGLERKVNLSGYVVLSDKSFVVSDAEASCCYLFDLENQKWSDVVPFAGVTGSLPLTHPYFSGKDGKGILSGKSVFAEGFIYTCTNGGLAAYEIIELEDSHSLGFQIYLEIPWHKFWERDAMCLEYVGKDSVSDAIVFCVVQGNTYHRCPCAPCKHPVWITTIHVKTERMPNGNLEPVEIGRVDVGTFFVEQDGRPFWTSSCFAAAW